jgi:hypothetical protein
MDDMVGQRVTAPVLKKIGKRVDLPLEKYLVREQFFVLIR